MHKIFAAVNLVIDPDPDKVKENVLFHIVLRAKEGGRKGHESTNMENGKAISYQVTQAFREATHWKNGRCVVL